MTGKPSIDKPWLKFYPDGADKVPLPEMTAYEYLFENNKDYMAGIALEYFGVKISYNTLFEKINEVAKAFAAQGVKRGDIVTIMMPNTPEAIYCFYALNKIGACANIISPTFTLEHITESIKLTCSKLLVILDKFYTMLLPVTAQTGAKRIIVVSGTETLGQTAELSEMDYVTGWRAFITLGECQVENTAAYEAKTPAAIIYSSGSTGAAKGIVLPNEAFSGLVAQYDAVNHVDLRNARGKRAILLIPIFMSTGINATLNTVLCNGMVGILLPSPEPYKFIQAVKDSKPNYLLSSISYYEAMLKNTDSFDDLSFLLHPTGGGEPLSPSLEKSINEFFRVHGSDAVIVQAWGLCEFGSQATAQSKHRLRKGTGTPLSHTIISAFDPDTDEELTYYERGEIRVITPCQMLGYYKNPEATAAFFREGKDGRIWGCSGDVGYIDEEGNVFIEGRADDFICDSSGEKIWLFDIESTLLADEAIQLCEVVGLAVDGGYIHVAHLVLKESCEDASENVIRRVHKTCVETLLPNAVPHGYKIRQEFNMLPSGKRDTLSLKNERDGFVQVSDDGELMPAVF